MAPASKKKSVSKKKKSVKTAKPTAHSSNTKVEKALVDNFVALQKVMVNLSAKFDNLSTQISKLLELFEISAKSLAQKDIKTEKENKDTKKILEGIDKLSQQSGLIGRGLTLIHQINSEKGVGREPEQVSVPFEPKPAAPMPKPEGMQSKTQKQMLPPPAGAKPGQGIPGRPGMQGYQRSISSQIPKDNA